MDPARRYGIRRFFDDRKLTLRNLLHGELSLFSRYVCNGLFATAIHFGVLVLLFQYFAVSSAGLANMLSAVVGLVVSFFGNRYFVFRKFGDKLFSQAAGFSVLYGLIALLHGGILFLWSDLQHWDYRIGFVVATAIQMLISYFGNKMVVFR